MELGIAIFPTEAAVSPVEIAQAAEAAGFESFWVPEHTHIPVRGTPYPAGGELPDPYKRTLDPFVTLAAVAGATSTIKIGTGVCLVIERDPIITAKEVATLDVISGGRFLFGVGAGWNRAEMRNHGTDPATRFDLFAERIDAMRTIWREDEPEYHGRYVDFDPIWCWPKPLQRPHPPILVGGNTDGALRRVVASGDAWIPTSVNPAKLPERIAELNRLAAEDGRGPVPVVAFGARPDRESVARFEDLGVQRCVFWVPTAGRDVVLPLVEQYASLCG